MKKPNGYWNYDRCKMEALKFNSKKELKDRLKSCYTTILAKKWHHLMDHMTHIGNLYTRCVYVYEFSNNNAYVGLTLNLERRDKEHKSDKLSSVYKYLIENTSEYNLIKLSDYINNSDAIQLEIETINKYKSNGWILLNKVKGGSLGGNNTYWTKERCLEEALKYKSKKDFREGSYSCYKTLIKNKSIDEFITHMIPGNKPKRYWSKERCLEEALKYKTKKDFRENSPNCYGIVSRNNWLCDITQHMIELVKPKNYWNYDNCLKEALKYNSKKEFMKNSYNCYKIAYRKKFLDKIVNIIELNN